MNTELIVAITGAIEQSNFDEYKFQLLESIAAKDIELHTDSDFAEAALVVKACESGELAIKTAKEAAVAGMADVNALFEAMDEVKEQMRKTRLSLNKKIKTEKLTRKQMAIDAAEIMITDHIESLDIQSFATMCSDLCSEAHTAIQDSTRGRSSIDKIKEVTMETALEYIGKIADREVIVRENMAYLQEVSADTMSLFHDRIRLYGKPQDHFKELVDTRLLSHESDVKAKELKIKEQERRAKEYKELADANKAKEDAKMIGEDLAPKVAPTPEVAKAKRAGMNWIMTIHMSGEKSEAVIVAALVKRVLDEEECVTSIKLNPNHNRI